MDTINSHPLRLKVAPGSVARQEWRAAHEEASRALTAWTRAALARRSDAYAVYLAAADREDAALRALAYARLACARE
jgi:hypothetical protein